MRAVPFDYAKTGCFSEAITRYINEDEALREFYRYPVTFDGFAAILKEHHFAGDRNLLTEVLSEQYSKTTFSADHSAIRNQQLELLKNPRTFTVTTGHQLNIFTGPLYFIYKIVTTIKLARDLKARFPQHDFVPVYWMATEDHDFPEIDHTTLSHKKIQWKRAASGATGRLDMHGFETALREYIGVLGGTGFSDELSAMAETAYLKNENLANATRSLVDALFGQYGLIITDADDARLKRQFAPVMEQDIIGQKSFELIEAQSKAMEDAGIKPQVHPREINFFYLQKELRERIVQVDDHFEVLNMDIKMSRDELLLQIKNHPENFSPNVVMRPLYQETILPNIAYIGGGAEVTYWFQLKTVFEHYKVSYPVLMLRNSVAIIRKHISQKIRRMEMDADCLFVEPDQFKTAWVKKHSRTDLSLNDERRELNGFFERLKLRAYKTDPTLAPSTEAVKVRLEKAIGNLEHKLLRAEKRRYESTLQQIDAIHDALFPGGALQERSENFGLYYVLWGRDFIQNLIDLFHPLGGDFTLIFEEDDENVLTIDSPCRPS
ncbi:MAG: bacillithiol biosynthesis cysteine-adding enzyme BshC [Mucilaginibacter polytrichastri]|nr:bacillithiol biosynthesis cysteine-adding enzyme BshC [Mucilaginibacter polytrichastri]